MTIIAVSQIWGIKSTPKNALEYIARFDKSDEGALVFSSLCSNDPKLANLQMAAHRKRFGKDKGILLHHGFVSFQKDEISKEKAYEFAKAFMESHFGSFQYYGSIHMDTEHIHFNFAINAVGLDGKKYYGNKKGVREMRAEVDRHCRENNLSVIIPEGKGMNYKAWLESGKNTDLIKSDVDRIIPKADSFEHFISLMKEEGYFIKYGDNVKHILFKKSGMQKGSRGRALGPEYTEQAITDRIRFKEFDFVPLKSELQKPSKRLKPVERELMRMYYRRPTMATNVAMGIHILNSYLTGEKHRIMRYTPAKKNRINRQYLSDVKKLSQQINFCHENNIRTRLDLDKKIEDLKKQLLSDDSYELKNKLKEYFDLQESLDSIRERSVIEKVQLEVEKEDPAQEKRER